MRDVPPQATCAEPAPKTTCAFCGRLLDGRWTRDQRGRFFCARHDDIRECRYCDRGFLPGPDLSAFRCARCAYWAVSTDERASDNYRRVLDWLKSNGLGIGNPPGIERSDVMPKLPSGLGMLAFVETVSFGGRAPTPRRLVVQNGLPVDLLTPVLAHEMGHVWLAGQSATLSNSMEEGICDWLAHAFAISTGRDDALYQARRIERRTDPIYGQGFRRFRDLAGTAPVGDLPRLLKTWARDLRT